MGKIRMYDKKYMNDSYAEFLYLLMCKKNNKYSYHKLFDQLLGVDFYWEIPLDENRSADGLEVRRLYLDKNPEKVKLVEGGSDIFMKANCSVLEMLIGLANRMNGDVNFNDGKLKKIFENFWELLENLGLKDCDDVVYDHEKVDVILNILLNREYESSGKGGLFPLKNAQKDQKKVEIWYQMQAYFNEKLGLV